MHLTDAELLAEEPHPHLANCWQCLERQAKLQRALESVIEARASIPAANVEAFRARLHALPPVSKKQNHVPTIAIAIAATLIIGLWWLAPQGPRMPDAKLTPGKTLALSREQVCAVPEADDARIIPASLAGQVFESYGIRPTPRTYEVDYLIGPELGGATDVRNLWPQPYAGGVWNAHVKDALENHLRHLVCEGQVDLPTAQSEIAKDWVAAYRKYFRTDRPLAAHAAYLKDHPWE